VSCKRVTRGVRIEEKDPLNRRQKHAQILTSRIQAAVVKEERWKVKIDCRHTPERSLSLLGARKRLYECYFWNMGLNE